MDMMTTRVIQTEGAALRIIDGGSAEPALVFLHYWGGSARTWQPVINRLVGQARCVALNQRGWSGSTVEDDRYGLGALADDVERVTAVLGLQRYVLVGHSMGGKVAQILATRRPRGLLGLVLVAPAPPTPMPVSEAQRADMLASYGSREGVLQALNVLAGAPLLEEWRDQVIEDTLSGTTPAKRMWTERGMIEDISDGLGDITIPVSVVVGSRDRVEHETSLRKIFGRLLPQARFRILEGVGHLSPLEAPDEVAQICAALLARI